MPLGREVVRQDVGHERKDDREPDEIDVEGQKNDPERETAWRCGGSHGSEERLHKTGRSPYEKPRLQLGDSPYVYVGWTLT